MIRTRAPSGAGAISLRRVIRVSNDGALVSEFTPHDSTNVVRSLEARVNNHKVWIRVEAAAPQVADLIVQARTGHGTADVELAHQLSTEIALELVHLH